MFFFATTNASLEISANVTFASLTRWAIARPMQPEPVQRSKILGLLSKNSDFLIVGDGVLIAYRGNAENVEIPAEVKTIAPGAFQR